ncbi:hypothetical protein E1I18_01935 [Mycoplasmopsis mucosicanis]|uniref:Uncharacterized protein n=1 Tax=Mycoplasmopsis mucosicanis TaxID=458208 RepID=A0A507SQV0_9BACT|nr:hypothetical protein [Mycoplasmopsis mucosicanis]TQC51533.1 hypothetical protein E1I18_01935 [Mycoplasmopsis mucosicanis]
MSLFFEDEKEESAPAVVGQISVSNELLDFTIKKPAKKCESKCDDKKDPNCGLTPREKAIQERKAAEAKKSC